METFRPPRGVRVLYSDVDGTMVGRGGSFMLDPEGSPTEEPAAALARALRSGLEIVPCSGRAMPGIARDARMLGMATAIGEMGAVISYDTGREIVTNLGAYPGGDELPVEHMERTGAVDVLTKSFPLELHLPWARQRHYTHLLRGFADTGEAARALEDAGFGWLELVDNGKLYGAYLDLPQGTSHAYHLLPRGVSKAAAIEADQRRRGFDPSECVAIGDSLADLGMAPHVAVLVLTADCVVADPSLGEAAARVANAVVTERPGNLGWAAAVASLAATR